MKSFWERTLTAALWLFAPAMVMLAVVGGIRGHTAVPIWDMWHGYLDFYYRAREGQWSAWWGLHNEHRIVLSRPLFWIDLAWFRGTVWFLVAVNYLLVLGSCLTFWVFMRERAPESAGAKQMTLLTLLLFGWMFSWVQNENLTWGFQSQFILAQLVPLLAFYQLHRATQAGPDSNRHFVLAGLLGVLSVGTMANGVLALPVLCAGALILRMGWKRVAILLAVCMVCLWAYFVDYHPHDARANPLATAMQQPSKLLQYVLLYLGSPFHLVLRLRALTVGQLFGLLLVVLAIAKAIPVLKQPRQHSLELALLAFLAYIMGTALVTGGGRLMMEGLRQATSSRYATPALMAWAALFVLYLPWMLQQLAAWRHRIVWPLLTLLVVMLPVQTKALRSVRSVHFEQEVGALALALGIADDVQVRTMFFDAAAGVRLARQPAEERRSIFGQAAIASAHGVIGQHRSIPVAAACTARLDSVSAVEADPQYVRVRGWLAGTSAELQDVAAAELLDQSGNVAGFVLAGPPLHSTVADVPPNARTFAGYLRASEARHTPRLLSVGGACNTPATVSAFRASPDPTEMARSGIDLQSVIANQGWDGGDSGRSSVAGAKVLGSYVRGDADVGTLTLKLQRGSSIYYRSGPKNEHQLFAIDDGKLYAGSLPMTPEWTVLVFDSPDLPEEFTLTLQDKGAGWGEWSAVALREPGNRTTP